MEALLREASQLAVSVFPGTSAGSDIYCRPCLSLKYGDICIGRPTNHKWALPGLPDDGVFTGAKVNPQGQLCLSLNRPITFRRFISEILEGPPRWDCHGDSGCHKPILVMQYCSGSGGAGGNEQLMTGSPRQLSVSEGRIVLVQKTLIRILSLTGHRVKSCQLDTSQCSDIVEAKGVSKAEQNELLRKLFDSFSDSDSSFSHVSIPQEEFVSGMESSAYVSRTSPTQSLVCEARRYLQERGETGYDANIDTITVRGEGGDVTRTASLAHKMFEIHTSLAEQQALPEKMVHVMCHADSFRLQQGSVLAGICRELHFSHKTFPTQHHILCSGVEVIVGDRTHREYPMATLLETRKRQMIEAFRIKYGEKALSTEEVQSMVLATTDAVVKFELLSTDPQSKLKLTLPDRAGQCRDVRFTGSFVLYNYARLANLVRNFEKACSEGTYPPLPADIGSVDFSLLTNEEEWWIFFHHLMQFPIIVREVTNTVCHSQTFRCQIKLKKICQFLCQLSHSVSTYYSRVKVLMAPEAHLVPLIHARLLLIKAIKQTMYHALQLLAIEPPQQL